jgi:thiamine kinase-like enzyme
MNQITLKKVINSFAVYADFISAQPYGSGHINDTYVVNCSQGGTPIRYILQKINHKIFKNTEGLMKNIHRVTQHQHRKQQNAGETSRKALTLIKTVDNNIFHKDDKGNFWRLYIFIENAKTYDIIEKPEQAYEAAKAFGAFQKVLVDLPGGPLIDTIPDFHNTPSRYQNLIEAVEKDPINRAKLAKSEIDFAMKHHDTAFHLLNLHKEGKMPERVTHNDTKLNNVMLDDKTGKGICVIDLDTVMPGLALYDFGDMVRTATRDSAEDEQDLSKVNIDIKAYEQLVKGYLSTAGEFLTKAEKENLVFSGKLISLEIGVRFLTDFLVGDTYFKTSRDGQNLDRCNVQFKMVKSIIDNEEIMLKLQEDL